MDKVYYYPRTKRQCLEKKYDIGYQKLSTEINSTSDKWNMSDDESDEEESLSKDHTDYSENLFLSDQSFVLKGRNTPILIMM